MSRRITAFAVNRPKVDERDAHELATLCLKLLQ
jgi:hypothetical protein